MSDLPPLEHSEDSRGMAGARVFYLHPKRENNQLQPDTHMPEVPSSQSRDTDQTPPVVDSIERQLAQMQKMAHGHYPDDEVARKAYLLGLMDTRRLELEAAITRLAGRFLELAVREAK